MFIMNGVLPHFHIMLCLMPLCYFDNVITPLGSESRFLALLFISMCTISHCLLVYWYCSYLYQGYDCVRF